MLVRVVHFIPAACGLASTIALIPVSIYTGRKLAGIRKQLMAHTDARIKLCSEVVTGISTSPTFDIFVQKACLPEFDALTYKIVAFAWKHKKLSDAECNFSVLSCSAEEGIPRAVKNAIAEQDLALMQA